MDLANAYKDDATELQTSLHSRHPPFACRCGILAPQLRGQDCLQTYPAERKEARVRRRERDRAQRNTIEGKSRAVANTEGV